MKTSGSELAAVFKLAASVELEPSYNVAPTHQMPIVHVEDGERRAMRAHWGLVPFWAKNRSIGYRMINARSETAHSSGAFRAAMRKRRCIVPVDGWYEWKKVEREKQPYRFHRSDERLIAVAGLFEHWICPDTGEVLDSFTILTTEPNAMARDIHDRMPVLLRETDWEQWLDPDTQDSRAMTQLCLPWGHDDLVVTPVSKAVGNVRNNSKELIEPVDSVPQQGTLF